MLDIEGSRPDFWCDQGVKHEILMGQDLDHGWGGSTGDYASEGGREANLHCTS